MTSLTTLWGIIYPDGTDDVRDGDDTIETLARRLDYLLGEQGIWNSPAAAGTSTATINLSRPYPNGFRAYTQVQVAHSGDQITTWTLAEAGTAGPGGVGSFTIGVNTTAATSRAIKWFVRPLP